MIAQPSDAAMTAVFNAFMGCLLSRVRGVLAVHGERAMTFRKTRATVRFGHPASVTSITPGNSQPPTLREPARRCSIRYPISLAQDTPRPPAPATGPLDEAET